MTPLVFVDTWAWLALAFRRDQFHAAAKRRHADLLSSGRRYVTTDYVLAELVTQLYRLMPATQAEQYFAAVISGCESHDYQLEHISPSRFAEAWRLRRQYADKPSISFVDLTSIAVMKELAITDVFSGDDHFSQVNLGFRLLD